jgi:hypothetical protein
VTGHSLPSLGGKVGHFLLLCLRARWDPAQLEEARTLAGRIDLDLSSLAQVAHLQGLAPQLFQIVRGQPLIPAPLERELRGFYYANAARNSRLFHELHRVLSRFAAEGVPVMALKGAALAETVYGNAAVRPMTDLDLLVPPAQVRPAQAALAGLNYSMDCREPWPGFSRRYRSVMEYQQSDTGRHSVRVDLHWWPLDVPYYRRILTKDLFARAQTACIAGTRALVPGKEDHLLCLCGHMALHERYKATLMRSYDMAMLIHHQEHGLDWELVMQRSMDWGLVIPLQRALARLERLWPACVPGIVSQEVAGLRPTRTEQRIHRWAVDRRQNPTSDVLLSLATMPGLGPKTLFLLEQAFPSPAYMRGLYCRSRPGLWPLAYLQRAGLGLRFLLRSLSLVPAREDSTL